MEQDLTGRVAIVTGAARGIGKAIASEFISAGANVLLVDLPSDELTATATNLGALAVPGNVSHSDTASSAAAAAMDSFGRLDIVVNNAGIIRDGRLDRMTDEAWDSVLDVSLRGAFYFMRAASILWVADSARRASYAKVVNVSSTIGVHGKSFSVNYAAAKAGIIGASKAAARELGRHRVNVNVIAPGHIAGTGLLDAPLRPEAAERRDEAMRYLESCIPLGRPGEPSDIAAAAHFLAGPGSDHVTGQVLEVHGGLEIHDLPAPPVGR